MNYQFISNEQTKQDWLDGKVWAEHQSSGESYNLNKLCSLCDRIDKPNGNANYYLIIKSGTLWISRTTKSLLTPYVTTDELYDMVFGEGKYKPEKWDEYREQIQPHEEREIIGYELNGKVDKNAVRHFLDCSSYDFPLKVDDLHSDKIIQHAKDLGILSTCFRPIYKDKEVKISLSNGYDAVINKKGDISVESCNMDFSITDIQRILDAHKTL